MQRGMLVALAVVIVLALGAWALMQRSARPAPPAAQTPPSAAELADPGADVVARAMESTDVGRTNGAPVDSTAYKTRWLDEVRNVDYADLDAPRRELFVRFANAERCTCGCGYTLATCKASDMTCEVSGAMIAALMDSIRAGQITSAKGVRARPKHGGS